MELIQVEGVGLEVLRLPGTAPGRAPIVFLHEGLGSVAMWRDWPQQVCRNTGRAGVVYSRRGYGKSQAIPNVRATGRLKPDYMHREALRVLPQLLEKLEIELPVLLGHSDGATIALVHASHFPVTACIAMAPHVIVEDESIQAIEEARGAFECAGLRERLRRYHADVDCAFWQWNDVWLSPAFREFDIRAECRGIQAPVLAIQGEDDPYGTLRQIAQIEPTHGSFEKHVLSQCGHSPHRDQPQQTREFVARFLARLP